MRKRRPSGLLDFNAPVILGLTAISFFILLLGLASNGTVSLALAIRFTSWSDPLLYPRLFTHILSHQDMAHFTGNFLLILAVGPLAEEKYGSRELAFMIAFTALVTGIVNVVFFKHVILYGASAVVFMLILLASFSNVRYGSIPVTFILVGFLYIGGEIYSGIQASDNISRLSHIIGGLCGAAFGFLFHQD